MKHCYYWENWEWETLNCELGSLSKHSFICAGTKFHVSSAFISFSKSVWWTGPEFPLLPTHLWSSEYHNSRTTLFNRWVLPSISKALLGYLRLLWHSGLYFCFSLKTPFNEWASASCFWEFWIDFKEQPWYTFSVNAVLSIKAWYSSACMPMALPG